VLAYFAEHKNGGYKAACRAAGMAQITRAEARALLHSDEEIREARFKAMGLDEPRLFELLGSIAGDGEHKDQFRAVTWGLNASPPLGGDEPFGAHGRGRRPDGGGGLACRRRPGSVYQ